MSGAPRAKKPAVRQNPERAERVIAFIECLSIPSGEGQGGPFRLRDWQKRFIRDVYSPMTADGRRVVRRAVFSLPRKNGKTPLAAALVLTHLIGPESIENGEIYSAANDREQAGQVFKYARQMVEADPELIEPAGPLRIISSTKTILAKTNGSFFRAVSAEAGTKHGFNASMVIFDELAQARNRELYDVLDTSMGARLEPLFLTISTQSNDPEHILSKLIDDGLSKQDPTIVCHLYAADEGCDLSDLDQWTKSNPALGDFRSEEDLAAAVRKAVRMPAEEPKVRNLFLNQRVSASATLIARADWEGCKGETDWEDGEEIYLGLDLSMKTDLTAMVGISANGKSRVQAWFWKPAASIEEHERRDRVPYQQWINQGLIEAIEGRTIHPRAIALRIAEIHERYKIVGLAYDRWQIDHLLRDFDEIGLEAHKDGEGEDGLRLVPWGQGFRDMSPAIDALETAVLCNELVQPGNPVLTWNMANAVAVTDPAGGRKIDKSAARFRIDGAVALAMAQGLKARDRREGEEDVSNPWEDAEFRIGSV